MTKLVEHLRDLSGDGYLYLATPYSRYPAGTETAFQEAARGAAWCIRHGIGVFCPITHSHPIAVWGQLSLTDHDIWLPADRPLMRCARGILVYQMAGWDESFGIKHEIEFFTNAGLPVAFLPYPLPGDQ